MAVTTTGRQAGVETKSATFTSRGGANSEVSYTAEHTVGKRTLTDTKTTANSSTLGRTDHKTVEIGSRPYLVNNLEMGLGAIASEIRLGEVIDVSRPPFVRSSHLTSTQFEDVLYAIIIGISHLLRHSHHILEMDKHADRIRLPRSARRESDITVSAAAGMNTSNPNRLYSYNLSKEIIEADLNLSERPQWPFSAYGPGKDAPRQLFGGFPLEQSFEEMRVLHYLAVAQGNPQQAVSKL